MTITADYAMMTTKNDKPGYCTSGQKTSETNRQDRRFARRKPPAGLRPEPAPLLSQGQALQVVSRGKGAMNASSAVCNGHASDAL